VNRDGVKADMLTSTNKILAMDSKHATVATAQIDKEDLELEEAFTDFVLSSVKSGPKLVQVADLMTGGLNG